MALGALVDAGLTLDVIVDALDRMGVRGVSLDCEQSQRGGLTGTFARVILDAEAGEDAELRRFHRDGWIVHSLRACERTGHGGFQTHGGG